MMMTDTPAALRRTNDDSIGRILLDLGKITPGDAERVLALQAQNGMRFGEAAQHLGLVDASDIQQILATQFDYQYAPAHTSGFDPSLVAAVDPFGREAEMLRALRGQLTMRWFTTGHKALAVVAIDATAAAGAVAANLAIVYAQQGRTTVLIDANMRAPRQHTLFGLHPKSGLSDALAGRAAAPGLARVPPFDTLSLLGAGPQPPNPHELLGRPSFAALDQALVRAFDVVLYDAPALSAGADAYAIAARTGAVLLVVSKNVTRQAALREARAQFMRAGAEIVGSLLVDF